jgi:hypothetical protein
LLAKIVINAFLYSKSRRELSQSAKRLFGKSMSNYRMSATVEDNAKSGPGGKLGLEDPGINTAALPQFK